MIVNDSTKVPKYFPQKNNNFIFVRFCDFITSILLAFACLDVDKWFVIIEYITCILVTNIIIIIFWDIYDFITSIY